MVLAAFVPLVGACGTDEGDEDPSTSAVTTTASTPPTSSGDVVAPPPRGTSNGVAPAGADVDDVRVVAVLTGARQVSSGDRLRGEATLMNTSASAIVLAPDCEIERGLYFDGERAAAVPACAPASGGATLAPTERRVVPFEVDTSTTDGGPLAPGVYDLFVGARVAGGTPGVRWGAPVQILVTG